MARPVLDRTAMPTTKPYRLLSGLAVGVLALAAACQTSIDDAAFHGSNSGSGSGSGADGKGDTCGSDADCALAAATCCESPTFAVSKQDPLYAACQDVACDPIASAPPNASATCSTGGVCVVTCATAICTSSCATGYAIDEATGCLSCTCQSGPAPPTCSADSDCVRTRADCCGCAHGGQDTAVLASDQASFDASLGCPTDPSCPSTDSCATGLSARCIEGACELAQPIPPGACGSAGLPACPNGQNCVINSDPTASAQGLGVCM